MLRGMGGRRAKRRTDPLNQRTKKDLRESHRILHGKRRGYGSVFDPAVHPAALAAYFQKALDQLEDAERITTKHGDVRHVKSPVTPPTLSGFAAMIGVCPSTLLAWEKASEEFKEVMGYARSIQQDVLIQMGAQGAYDSRFTALLLKNLHGWSDRAEVAHKGSVILNIDAQDSKA